MMKLYNLNQIVSLAFYGLVIFVTTDIAQSQDTTKETEPIIIGTAVTIDSEILDEERRILVHLPEGYETSGSVRYPVLYLLDGETQFNHVTGIVDFLSSVYRIPPMIVIGVTNTDRNRDMTPPTDQSEIVIPRPFSESRDSLRMPVSPTAGGADNFLSFLIDELVPWVETKYQTTPFRMLVGHSFSGLFTVHTFISRPESFQTYLAMSPSLQWDNRSLIHKSATKLESLQLDGRFLYLTAGENEMRSMVDNLQVFAVNVEEAKSKGLRLWHRVMPNESHPSVVHKGVYDGLEAIFDRYRISEKKLIAGNISAVEAHFAEASKFYGYKIEVPEKIINTMGYMQLQIMQQPEKAVEIFRHNTELYSTSANVYDSLGDGLSAAGRLKEAKKSYQKAVRLAEQHNHTKIETYRANLQRVSKQLRN